MPAPRRLPTIPHPDQPALPVALTSAVGFLAREVTGLFRLRFEEVMRAYQLKPNQYLLLQVLRDEGAAAQQALGQRLGMDRTTTMQSVQALADAGLVDRQDDPADRRVYRVSLTNAGRQLLDVLETRLRASEDEVMAPLTTAERALFEEQLRRILAHDQRGAASPGGGGCGGSGA